MATQAATTPATEPSLTELAVETRGLHVSYGAVDVLRDINIEVRPGELVALLGPNGAGKTTPSKTLAGYQRASAGDVYLFGEGCNRVPAHRRCRRGVSILGEQRHIFPGLTVRQSLRLVDHPDAARQLFPALVDLEDQKAGLLSGGEQQMLALGLALAREPRLVLIDELSLGLAPLIRERLLDSVRASADSGVGVLVVEQNARAVLRHADRAYVMRRGEIVDASPASRWLNDLDGLAELYLT